MEQELNTDLQSQKSDAKKVTVAVIAAVLLTAIVVGGGVYTWSRSVSNKQIASLQEQITQMQTQFADSQNTTVRVSPSPELSESNSPPTSIAAMKTYTSASSTFKLQLPADWVIFSTYDGTPSTISQLDDGYAPYGPRDESRTVTIESFTSENVAKEYRNRLYELVLDIRFNGSDYPLTNKRTEGAVTIYEHTAKPGLEAEIKGYIIFEKSNIIVLLGFAHNDQLTQDIVSSFEFLK